MASPSSQLSVEEAGRQLGVNPNTVRSWLEQGRLLALYPDDVDGLRKRLDADWDAQGKRIA